MNTVTKNHIPDPKLNASLLRRAIVNKWQKINNTFYGITYDGRLLQCSPSRRHPDRHDTSTMQAARIISHENMMEVNKAFNCMFAPRDFEEVL